MIGLVPQHIAEGTAGNAHSAGNATRTHHLDGTRFAAANQRLCRANGHAGSIVALEADDGCAQFGATAVDVDACLGRPTFRTVGEGAGQLTLATGDTTFHRDLEDHLHHFTTCSFSKVFAISRLLLRSEVSK